MQGFHPETQALDCLLISPPHWYPFEPHQGLAALQAHLRREGFSSKILDLNLMTLDSFLTRETLEKLLEEAENRTFRKVPPEAGRKRFFQKIAVLADRIFNQVENAKQILRDCRYYDYGLRSEALKVLYLSMQIVTACYYPTRYTLNGFRIPLNLCNPEDLLRFTESEAINPFLHYMTDVLKHTLSQIRPKVIGISITGAAQVAGGATAARIVKSMDPSIHIVIGGSYFSRLGDQVLRFPHLFQVVDSIILFEGENALSELIHALCNGNPLRRVPQLIWKNGPDSRIEAQFVLATPDVKRLPAPDFDGMALPLYLAPEIILPISASRGCYWRRCSFCDHGYGYQGGYREKSASQVCEEMTRLHRLTGSSRFDFVDEALKPSLIRRISEILLENRCAFKWMGLARIDRRFDPETFRLMQEAGCRQLSFGVESHDERILRLMKKGTTPSLNLRVLSDSKRAGIWTHIMLFFGFPGEDPVSAEATFSLIQNQAEAFNDAGVAAFVLGRHSPIFRNPERFGIRPDRNWKNALAWAYDVALPYRIHGADTFPMAEKRARDFQSLTVQKKGSFERSLSFLYSSRWNTNDFKPFIRLFRDFGTHRRLGDLNRFNTAVSVDST